MRLTTRNISRYRRTVRATPTHGWVLADGQKTNALGVGQFVPAVRATADSRLGELPARGAPRPRLRRRVLEQARDPLGRASPLRPALWRASGRVRGLLRRGELLALARRAPRICGDWCRALVRQPEARAARDARTRSTSRGSSTDGSRWTAIPSKQDPGAFFQPTTMRSRGSSVRPSWPGTSRWARVKRAASRPTSASAAGRSAGSTSRRVRSFWRVMSVEAQGGDDEDTFCAVVPGKHEFALAGGITTRNCGACEPDARSRRSSRRTRSRTSGTHSSRSTTRSRRGEDRLARRQVRRGERRPQPAARVGPSPGKRARSPNDRC